MKLKELQKDMNKTIKEVANDLNLPFSTYNNYLLETREPNIETLKKLANYFNVSVDYLIENDATKFTVYNEEVSQSIKLMIQLNHSNQLKAFGYIAGLLANQN